MSDPTFTSVTVRQDAGAARADLLTIDTVDGADGNGGALRFVNNSSGALGLTLGRVGAVRVDASTVRLELGVAADPSLVSGYDTPALLSLEKGAGAPSVVTAAGSSLHAGGPLHVAGATALSGVLSVSGPATLNGGLAVNGAIAVTGTINGRNLAADGGRLDGHLASSANPHGTTAAQVGALAVTGGAITGNLAVNGNLSFAGELMWGAGSRMNGDQGGAIELGDSTLQGTVPYIDFHYGVGAAQDYNVRLINFADRELALKDGSLRISGGLTVGAGSSATLSVRHIDGKDWQSDNPDALYLNWGTGKPVYLGFGNNTQASLFVSGNLGVGTDNPQRRLDVNGDIMLAGGQTLYSPGRLHINGEETLYLLNKSGVIVSKAWGGNGNLAMEGNLDVNGAITLAGGQTLYSPGRLHINGEEALYLLNKSGVIVSKAWGGNGNLAVEGNLTVGAGSNGNLSVRHIDGKHWQNDGPDGLHLNWSTGYPVYIGNPSKPASLHVFGNISLDGRLNKLDVAEDASAMVRAHDLWLGTSWRRGASKKRVSLPGFETMGRALVDDQDTLVLNYAADWPYVRIDGKLLPPAQGSTRKLKDDIQTLPLAQATAIVMELNAVSFRLKADEEAWPQLGFIAEEVPNLVGTSDHEGIRPTGILAAAIKVIQEQQRRLADLEARLR